jgi:hypothetical protein
MQSAIANFSWSGKSNDQLAGGLRGWGRGISGHYHDSDDVAKSFADRVIGVHTSRSRALVARSSVAQRARPYDPSAHLIT